MAIRNVRIEVDDANPTPEDKWIGGYAITKNISLRLKRVKELSFRKWRIVLSDGKTEESHICWEEEREMEMKLFFAFSDVENCRDIKYVKLVYEMIFEALACIWNAKGWNLDLLDGIHKEIKSEDYKVSVQYRKDFSSPDKRHKAAIYCELYPDYSDCYIVFIGRGNRPLRRIKFLKGDIDPEFFLGFFPGYYWPDNSNFIISDRNKEIFYVFNVNSDDFSIEYKEVYNTLDTLKRYVKAFEYGLPYKEKRRLLGLPS